MPLGRSAILTLACAGALAAGGCGGSSDESEPSGTGTPTVLRVSTHAAPALERELPVHVAGLQLQTKSFTGDAWLKIAPRILPSVDFAHWLNAIGATSSTMTAGWGETTKIAILVYRGVGGRPGPSLQAFAESIEGRRSITRRTVSRKSLVAVNASGGTTYLYAKDELLFQVPFGTATDDLRQLVAQLS